MEERTVSAIGIVTVTKWPYAKIYNESGKAALDRGLKPGSEWKTDIVIQANGMELYRIGLGEYVNANDVSFRFA